MSWLLFLDESGHDHRTMPYEVRGGFAIHASKLWPFIQAVRTLEQSTFGTSLHDHGTEIKGSKLLQISRFKWQNQSPRLDDAARRKHALNFLNNSRQGRTPRRDEFTAYGQACIQMADGVAELLRSHEAKIFAAMIPCVKKPTTLLADYLRKDIVFLLERFFYFLEERRETGLLVMDGSDKDADRQFVRRLERYFTEFLIGRQRTKWIVPVPLFVESDMAYGVQVADLCIYAMNWAYRRGEMDGPQRVELQPLVGLLEQLIWSGDGYRDGRVFKTRSVVFVPDPYDSRADQK